VVMVIIISSIESRNMSRLPLRLPIPVDPAGPDRYQLGIKPCKLCVPSYDGKQQKAP
jgi:hypothetical protein